MPEPVRNTTTPIAGRVLDAECVQVCSPAQLLRYLKPQEALATC
jgi:hypothetical protein